MHIIGSVVDTDPDQHYLGKLEPDPHQSGKLDPDQDPHPHQSEKQFFWIRI
jgi:hypothetical protein